MESKGEGGLASIPSDDHSSADHVPSNLNQETTTNEEKDDNQATQEKLKGDEDKDEDKDQKFSIIESKVEGGLASMPSDDHSLADVPSNSNEETTTNKEKDDNQATQAKPKFDSSIYMDTARCERSRTFIRPRGKAFRHSPFTQGEASHYSWLSELKEEDLLIVKVKTLQSNDDAENEKIPKHEAVCRFCFNIFENDNVLKTKCKCKLTLIHQECAIKWSREGNNKCSVCDQDIQNIPVFLLKFEASRSQP